MTMVRNYAGCPVLDEALRELLHVARRDPCAPVTAHSVRAQLCFSFGQKKLQRRSDEIPSPSRRCRIYSRLAVTAISPQRFKNSKGKHMVDDV